jgi:hypothetical protein
MLASTLASTAVFWLLLGADGPLIPSLPELPDPRLMETRVQDFQTRVAEVRRLTADLAPFAESISHGRPAGEIRQANLDLLKGRALVLCRLQAALAAALAERKWLEVQVARYDDWLRAAGGVIKQPAVPQPDAGPHSLDDAIAALSDQLRVLADMRREDLERRLDAGRIVASPEQLAAWRKEADDLRKFVGNSHFILNRYEYREKFKQLDANQQEQRMWGIARELHEKQDERRQLRQQQPGRADVGETSLLSERDVKPLQQSRRLLKATELYGRHADAVAANAAHLAELLEAIDRCPDPPKQTVIMLANSGSDAAAVSQLRTMLDAEKSAAAPAKDLGSLLKSLE